MPGSHQPPISSRRPSSSTSSAVAAWMCPASSPSRAVSSSTSVRTTDGPSPGDWVGAGDMRTTLANTCTLHKHLFVIFHYSSVAEPATSSGHRRARAAPVASPRVSAVPARYDGHAEWYDETFGVYPEDAEVLAQLLGRGEGEACLDVGCGAGRYAASIAGAGYRVVGVDISIDQLRIAAGRMYLLMRADARALPVRSGSIGVAVSLYIHTHIQDFSAVFAHVPPLPPGGGRVVLV